MMKNLGNFFEMFVIVCETLLKNADGSTKKTRKEVIGAYPEEYKAVDELDSFLENKIGYCLSQVEVYKMDVEVKGNIRRKVRVIDRDGDVIKTYTIEKAKLLMEDWD